MISGFRRPALVEYVARDTYLNIVTNYPPANYVGKQAFATDLGS